VKVLVIGAGGREHTLVWKLSQSKVKIFCAPGNGGIREEAIGVDIKPEDIPSLVKWAKREKIDFTVVGPEIPLSLGIADEFEKEGLHILGPKKEGARLEGDKAFAKELMSRYGIPTPSFKVFTSPEDAKRYISSKGGPWVIKASGLAYGKGSIVAKTLSQAYDAIDKIMVERCFGMAGEKVVVEDFLEGEEASIVALFDGETYLPFLPSQDHKPIYDGDKGPNTGGMGAYAPAPLIDNQMEMEIEKRVFLPLLRALKKEGIEYKGVIYAGVMVTKDGPFVLEFNCRFGDPETQPVLPLLENDLLDLLYACREGRLREKSLKWRDNAALCVVAASSGYPGSYEKGKPIKGNLYHRDDVLIFHAGTEKRDSTFYTSGGRVLGVTGIGTDLVQAKEKAYNALKEIEFEGIYYRRDIGDKGIRRIKGE